MITAAIDGNGTMSQLTYGYVLLLFKECEIAEFTFNGSYFSTERALILLEIYRKDDVWKIYAAGQGFNNGLDALIKYFGGDVSTLSSKVTVHSSHPLVGDRLSSINRGESTECLPSKLKVVCEHCGTVNNVPEYNNNERLPKCPKCNHFLENAYNKQKLLSFLDQLKLTQQQREKIRSKLNSILDYQP